MTGRAGIVTPLTSRERKAQADARRAARFATNSALRYGEFSARYPEYEQRYESSLSICGVCGEDLPDATAKAHHLEDLHRAVISSFEAPWGEAMYRWERAA